MTALALALHVLVAATGAPSLHLETPLALRLDPGPELSATVLGAPVGGDDGSDGGTATRGMRPREWAAASGMVLAGEAVLAGTFALAVLRGSSDDALVLAGTVVIAYALLPPALAVWGARLAGAPGDRGARAYIYGFLLRGVAVGLTALASRASTALAWVTWCGAELVAMPWVVARTLGDVEEQAWVDPTASAVPVHDPALATR